MCPSKSLSNNRLYRYYTVFPMFCQEHKNSTPDRAANAARAKRGEISYFLEHTVPSSAFFTSPESQAIFSQAFRIFL